MVLMVNEGGEDLFLHVNDVRRVYLITKPDKIFRPPRNRLLREFSNRSQCCGLDPFCCFLYRQYAVAQRYPAPLESNLELALQHLLSEIVVAHRLPEME